MNSQNPLQNKQAGSATTGCFLMIKGKYELITPFKMSLYKVKLDAKFHWGRDILIFISLNLKNIKEKKKITMFGNSTIINFITQSNK